MKNTKLENAVLTKTPEECAEICGALTEKEREICGSRALGLACRFRGLEWVKALTENGATFKYVKTEGRSWLINIFYWLGVLDMNDAIIYSFFIDRRDKLFSDNIQIYETTNAPTITVLSSGELISGELIDVPFFSVLPIERRVEIVEYLYKNSERLDLNISDLLYYSIISNSQKITEKLKQFGVKFSDNLIRILTESQRCAKWEEFCYFMCFMEWEKIPEIISIISEELGGKKLRWTDSVIRQNSLLYDPKIFRLVLDKFDQKKMNKKRFMTGAIDRDNTDCLKAAAEQGWLDQPRKRDEMIQYASDNGKTECTAWLLDFKNRTADFAAERVKAEKKTERELNADPNSVYELKKIWSYKKREDGTLEITSYKGKYTEVIVPEKIGKSTVTAIGYGTFSPHAHRFKYQESRLAVTKITLPGTINNIGGNAFGGCKSLISVNIPNGVSEICPETFFGCAKLSGIIIPDSVRQIGVASFASCSELKSIRIPCGVTELIGVFYNCGSLENIELPSTIKKIGKQCFQSCTALKKIIIPEGVEEIDCLAFSVCNALETVIIPASVKKIKNYKTKWILLQTPFHDCMNITAVVREKSYAEKYCKRNNIPFIIDKRTDNNDAAVLP